MKKIISLLAFAMLFADKSAFADPSKIQSLSPEQKQQIAWALHVLAQAKVISQDQNKCAQFDSDIIEELFKLGLLRNGDSEFTSVCIGASAK